MATTSCAQGEPNIPECQVEEGFYCCEKQRFYEDLCKEWVDCEKLRDVLKEFRSTNFTYQNNRNSMKSRWERLDTDPPFSEEKRFPRTGQYIVLKGDIVNHIADMLDALDIRDRVNEILTAHPEMASKLDASFIRENEQNLRQARLSFKTALTNIQSDIASDKISFRRETFEASNGEYNVIWTNGKKECARKVRSIAHLAPPKCCTFLDLQLFYIKYASSNYGRTFINPRDPYSPDRTVNIAGISKISDINGNAMLPSSPFYVYSNDPADRKIVEVTYDRFCVISVRDTTISFTDMDRPVRTTEFNVLNELLEDDE